MSKLARLSAATTVCSRFISLGTNFPKWSALSFSRNFPNLEIHDPNNQKLT